MAMFNTNFSKSYDLSFITIRNINQPADGSFLGVYKILIK